MTVPLLFLSLLLPCLYFALPVPNQNPDPLLSKPSPQTHVPIALLHMHDSISFFGRLGTLTGSNKARYAKRHGYDMVVSTPAKTSGVKKEVVCAEEMIPDAKGRCWEEDATFDIDHSRAPTFGKIRLALAACRGRDDGWLLWTDADALVVNQSIPLQWLIDDGYDLMYAYDWLMLNAGMLLIKCSDWSKAFLQKVYDARKFDSARALDQSALQEHLDNLTKSDLDLHVKVVPKYAMNVYTEEYQPGDFLMHFAGKLYEATEPGIVAIANQFDVLSMVDDIEDIRAFFRGRRFLNYYSGTCVVSRGHRQSECKPSDPRRILLNESLGSLSYPNRYRHVGLRYYWLGDWKDKYDVPGWNKKRKALPMPDAAPLGKEMPPLPIAAKHELEQLNAELDGGGESDMKNVADIGMDSKEDDRKQEAPEMDHETEGQHGAKVKVVVDTADGDDDDGDDGEDEGWSLWVKILAMGVAGIGVAAGCVTLKRRRTKNSKIQ